MSKNEYRRFAAVSLESTENAANLATKTHLLIMADAWLDLAERTTQLVDHEADEARGIMEPPLTGGGLRIDGGQNVSSR